MYRRICLSIGAQVAFNAMADEERLGSVKLQAVLGNYLLT